MPASRTFQGLPRWCLAWQLCQQGLPEGLSLADNRLWKVKRIGFPVALLARELRVVGGVDPCITPEACHVERNLQKGNFFEQKTRYARGFLSCGDGDEDTGLSKQYEESRVVGYSPEQIFSVVAAVDLYEDFVPWCQKSTVLRRKGAEALDAELEIGFKFFVERYISHVELKRPELVKTSSSQSSLFDYLINVWEFKPGPVPNSCDLHFFVDFRFRSPLYGRVANMFFDEVVSRLVSSFEGRCKTVYGPGSKVLERILGG
eukprot:c24561_g1_i1 orf=387-1166(-)